MPAVTLELCHWVFCSSDRVSLPQLTHLTLAECRFKPFADAPLLPVDGAAVPLTSTFESVGLHPARLRHLTLNCCAASHSNDGLLGCGTLARFSQLRSLSLAGSDFASDAVAAAAAQLPALQHLDLRTGRRSRWRPGGGAPRLGNTAAATLGGGRLRSSLRSLAMGAESDLSDAGVAALAQLTALTRLDLGAPADGGEVGDAGARAIGRGLPRLRSLRMGACRFSERGCGALGVLTQLTGAPRPSL